MPPLDATVTHASIRCIEGSVFRYPKTFCTISDNVNTCCCRGFVCCLHDIRYYSSTALHALVGSVFCVCNTISDTNSARVLLFLRVPSVDDRDTTTSSTRYLGTRSTPACLPPAATTVPPSSGDPAPAEANFAWRTEIRSHHLCLFGQIDPCQMVDRPFIRSLYQISIRDVGLSGRISS